MQSHDAEYRESGEGWARTPKPAAMTAPLSDTELAEPTYGVVFDRPDADRNYAWGPFVGFDAAARFAEFVQAEIDPAHVIPWQDALLLPGVRVLDAVTELLNWRAHAAATARPYAFREAAAAIDAELGDSTPVAGVVLAHSAQEAADLLRRMADAVPTV